MTRALLTLLCVVLGASLLAADDTPAAWAPEHRSLANAISNATVYSAIGLDVYHDLKTSDRKWRTAGCDALKYGLVELTVNGLKRIVKKERPDGTDHLSFPSGHTANAFAAVNGWKFGVNIPLAEATAYFRTAANKHDLWDVLGGAAIGSSFNWGVGKIPACRDAF